MDGKPIWHRLKTMTCPKPKCMRQLTESLTEDGYRCSGLEEGTCDFKISRVKFEEVVTSLYKPRSAPRDNLAELNNL